MDSLYHIESVLRIFQKSYYTSHVRTKKITNVASFYVVKHDKILTFSFRNDKHDHNYIYSIKCIKNKARRKYTKILSMLLELPLV